jgi:NADPH2:quinone reductase
MRALRCKAYGSVEDVKVEDCEEPAAPNANEVMIRIDYASVSHATGLMIQGRYQTKPALPFTPGTEAVGTVVACGSRVTRLKIGDAVVAVADWGCFGELLTLDECTVYPLPKGLSPLEALPVPISYGTAYCGLQWRCALKPGEDVLVLGAGAGVGLAAVELASLMGANVIACASTAAKRDEAITRGARHAVAPDAELAAQVKKLTGGRGVDIVVDPVGGDLSEMAIRATAANGRLLSVGFASGKMPPIAPNILLVKNLTWHGLFFGRYIGWTPRDERYQHAGELQQVMQTMLTWANEKHIRPTVSAVFPLGELKQALTALETRQVVGKVALSMSDKVAAP